MSKPEPGTDEWLNQVTEPIVDPDRPIVDPHHHLWRTSRMGRSYLLNELWADTGSGHNVRKTVFLECGASYLKDGPEHLKPVGETSFVAEIAAASRADDNQATIAAIVGRADLSLGKALDEVLDAHEAAADGLFRGIRHAGARATHPEGMYIAGNAPEGLFSDPEFRAGVRHLGQRGLTYESWHYHYQNRAFLDLAAAAPDTTIILDHFGTPIGVGHFADQRESIFERWKADMAALADTCPNVHAKLGGLAMPDNGFGWHTQERPPTSDEFVDAQRRYYLHVIECFGPERCMFESNFPVDRLSISYHVLYNGLKKMVADFSDDEKHALFYGTAERVYGL